VGFTHVVFDLDGTLIDSRADLAGAVNHVLRTLGLAEIDPTTLYGYVGEGARVLVERALGPVRQETLVRGVALFMEYYAEHLLDATEPYAGIVDCLTALAAHGVTLSVLTNKPVGMSEKILTGLKLSPYFIAVIGGDSLPTRKPDPAGLEHLRTLRRTLREETLLVGDSGIDVTTARAAQVAFCGVTWGLAPDGLRAANPERMIGHPSELIPMVARG